MKDKDVNSALTIKSKSAGVNILLLLNILEANVLKHLWNSGTKASFPENNPCPPLRGKGMQVMFVSTQWRPRGDVTLGLFRLD